MLISLSKGLRGVDRAMVCAQNCLGSSAPPFSCLQVDLDVSDYGTRFATSDRCCLVRKYLVVESIYKEHLFLISPVALKCRYVRNDDLNWTCCIPISLYFIRKRNMFWPCSFVDILPCLRSNTSLFTAFMCQIVREYPSDFLKYRPGKHMVSMWGMRSVLFFQRLCKQPPVVFVSVQLS